MKRDKRRRSVIFSDLEWARLKILANEQGKSRHRMLREHCIDLLATESRWW